MEQLFWMLAHHLSAQEGQVLAALAAPSGPSVSRTALAYISGVAPAELEEILLRLQELELLHVEGERCSLDDGLRLYLVQHAADDEMRARAAAYYLRQVGTFQVRARHPDEENVIAALAYYRDRGRWRQVLAIVCSLESYLIASARWGQWRKRLEDALQAGRELRDPRTEAWAQTQLGVVALAAGDRRGAAQLFGGASTTRPGRPSPAGTCRSSSIPRRHPPPESKIRCRPAAPGWNCPPSWPASPPSC